MSEPTRPEGVPIAPQAPQLSGPYVAAQLPSPAGPSLGPLGPVLDAIRTVGMPIVALLLLGWGVWQLLGQQREDTQARERMLVTQMDGVLRDVQQRQQRVERLAEDLQRSVADLQKTIERARR